MGGRLLNYGLGELEELITGTAGSPARDTFTWPTDYDAPSYRFPRVPFTTPQPRPVYSEPSGYNSPYPVFTPPLLPVPASQPYGVMPGTINAPIQRGDTMPSFPVTRLQSFPGYSAGFQPVSAIGALAGPIARYAAPLMRQLPGLATGLLAGEGIESMMESFAGSGAVGAPGGATPMFRPTVQSARPTAFHVPNPVTGRETWFKPAGHPILWSSDLAACKRVKKIARKVSRKR
jgi:hypothetical protein